MAKLRVNHVAATLTSADWEQVLPLCDVATQREIMTQLQPHTSKVSNDYIQNVYGDPRLQFAQMMKMMVEMNQKLDEATVQLEAMQGAGGRRKRAKKKKRLMKKNPRLAPKVARSASLDKKVEEEDEDVPGTHEAPKIDKARKGSYRFGNAKINYIKPKEGYPNARDALDKPSGGLVLEYAHGYQGKEMYGRGNMFFVSDERKSQESALVYHVAGVGVVNNCKERTQQFFAGHNDDITCIAVSAHPERDTLVATGQTDPKDFGEKDMPKIFIWDWTSMKRVKLITDAHWGMVLKVQFSARDDYLFSIGGETEHLMKVWSLANLYRKGKAGLCKEIMNAPTVKEDIFGFVVNPYKATDPRFVEEFLLFGRKKAYWIGLSATKKGMSIKLKSVLFSLAKEVKENSKLAPKAILTGDWLPSGKYVLGDNLGAMYICQMTKPLVRVAAHEGVLGALIVASPTEVITAGNDGHIRKWSINATTSAAKQTWSTDEPISFTDNDFIFLPRAMAYDKATDTVYVGSRTCQIMSYDIKNENSQILIDGHDDQVWGLTTCNKDGFEHYYITGGFDGVMKLWDCKERLIVDTYEFERKEGEPMKQIASCIWSNDGMLVAAGSEDGVVYLFTWFENRALELVAEYDCPVKKGREAEGVSYMRFSENDEILAVAHMDANMYLFTVTGHGKTWSLEPWKKANHRAAPTHLQWTADNTMIKVLTRDYEVAHWMVDGATRSLKFYPHQPDPDEIDWAGDPLVAGWDVQGCYQAEWDGTDLNDVTLSSDGQFLVAGDDFGFVRMYKYPAVSNKPEAHRAYLGHSSFVVGVEFCRDDSYLITCGGNDMGIFQWKLEKY